MTLQTTTRLSIGVRDLVEVVLRSGDLKFEFASGSRAVEAIRLHQRIQSNRPPFYRPEVAVSHRVTTAHFTLDLGGRIDGVFDHPAAPAVEEIKTTRRSLEDCVRSENPLHWGQAKIYAYLYAAERAIDAIEVQLTYARVDPYETREIRRRFAVPELKAFFDDVIARYLAWAAVITDWRRLRDASLRGLEFPYACWRPGQQEMAQAVARAVDEQTPLFIQAATGIGKTMAVLYPAVRALAAEQTDKVFYLTARTTGRMAAEKALDELRVKGLKLKAITLTAKEKICFHPQGACSPDECAFARGHYDRLPDARADVFRRDAWTRPVVAGAAQAHRVCPFEFALDLSLWADLIVCDYNHAFDPQAYLRRFFQEDGGRYTFLVDEAHNLVDRSREMFSAGLSKQPFMELRRAVKPHLPLVYRRLDKINRWMLAARKRCEESGQPIAEGRPPEELTPLLQGFLQAAEQWLEKNVPSPFRQLLLDRYFETSTFLRVADQFDETYAALTEAPPGDLRLKLFCIDPSRQMAAALTRCRTAVFFSATLAPLDYFKTMLGCEEAPDLLLPSPFPPENLAVFLWDRVSTLYRQRLRTRSEVARIARAFVGQRAGNFLLFFPSYAYMRMVQEAFRAEAPACRMVVQEPGMSETERDAFLARFENDSPQTLVGFAVLGGIFGEGIDLVGTRLSGVAVIGVGLPAVCLERELIRDYFAQRLEQGFEYSYMYPGINRVLQAAGRVIRTESDRGVVVLIDQRYGARHYRELLPQSWNPVFIRDAVRFTRDLQDFWG